MPSRPSPKSRPTPDRTRARLSVVSLFTGAGGLDLGFEAAGFETKVAIEMDDDAIRTLEKNRPQWNAIHADIRSEHACSPAILLRSRLHEGEADVLIGGPPCQPFSKSGYWAHGDSKRLKDPRSETLGAYLRVLRDLKPRAFLLENVPGLTYSEKDEGLQLLRRSIEEINETTGTQYSFAAKLMRAVEHGVPQDRQRVFIIGSRDGYDFRFPNPMYDPPPRQTLDSGSDQQLLSLNLSRIVESVVPRRCLTAWDAIADLEDDDSPELRVSGKWADLLPTIPEGRNYLFHTDRGEGLPLFGWRRRYWSFLLKLSKRLPSWTIAAQPGPAIGPFHWRNRRLSREEMMRLQTFPSGYTIVGSFRSAQRQLGNAVPSALAELLAREIRHQFFGDPALDAKSLILVPRTRGQPAAEERPGKVPKKYLGLVGRHSAHPGTGQGYGAVRRAAAAS